ILKKELENPGAQSYTNLTLDTLVPELDLPIPSDPDLGNALGHGRLQSLKVTTTNGQVDNGMVTGNLKYEFTIEYGFGEKEAGRSFLEGGTFLSAGRLLQLAGKALPFKITFEVDMQIRPFTIAMNGNCNPSCTLPTRVSYDYPCGDNDVSNN